MDERCCYVQRLGRVEYEKAWRLQDTLAAEIAVGARPPTLLLLEHPHTYTFGRRGQIENLLWDTEELERRGLSLHWVDRGGDVTYHGPGQLVGYPLLPLAPGGLLPTAGENGPSLARADYIGYLRRLEHTLVAALDHLGIPALLQEGLTGVWVQTPTNTALAKIAAIGIKVDARGISRHGFALNVQPDMAYWQGIIGCGLKGHSVTSLAEILPEVPDMQQVSQAVVISFGQIFDFEMVDET